MTGKTETIENTFIRITNRDIFDKLNAVHDEVAAVKVQTKKTNGRVTIIEAFSLGMWIRNNPYKSMIIFLMIVLSLIQESRSFVIESILSVARGMI